MKNVLNKIIRKLLLENLFFVFLFFVLFLVLNVETYKLLCRLNYKRFANLAFLFDLIGCTYVVRQIFLKFQALMTIFMKVIKTQ